jgi:hypothetical protein
MTGDEPSRERPFRLLGAPIGRAFLLGRSDRAAIAVQHISAFPRGFTFQVVALSPVEGASPVEGVWDPMYGLAGYRGRPGTDRENMIAQYLQLEVELADGGRPPLAKGAGGARRVDGLWETTMEYWVNVLPPLGPVAFLCQWPWYGIAPSRYELDGDQIVAASKRSMVIWPSAEETS